MKQLHWTPEAIQDREEIYDYIEAGNLVAALAFDELFLEKPVACSIIPASAGLVVSPALASW